MRIDWEKELQLPEYPVASDPQAKTPSNDINPESISTIFLTGATGFLGIFLLREILLQYPTANVLCLARGKTEADLFGHLKHELEAVHSWKDEYQNRISIVCFITTYINGGTLMSIV